MIVWVCLVAAIVALGAARAALVWKHRETHGSAKSSVLLASPATAQAAKVDELAARLAAGRAMVDLLMFIGATDTLDPSSDATLNRLAGALAATPGTFLVEAHVPPSGDVLADQSLTDRRAVAVRAALIAAGVPASRLVAMGFGATRSSNASQRARIELSRMP
jgi:outer membrane protein OmpA-like peptidoglycan-associated protein